MSKIGSGKNGSVSHPVTVNGKPPRAVEPGKVSRIGGQYIKTGMAEPKLKPFDSGVKLGNEVAKNVGADGRGGRTVHASGSQGTHGPANPGLPRPPSASSSGSDKPWRP